MMKQLMLASALLAACSDDPIFSASVDDTSGAFDDFDGCTCMVYNADHEVQFDCTDNITMYARHGYRETHRVPHQGTDLVFFRKSLQAGPT